MLLVAKHEFSPAPLYRVPVAGVEHGLQFIEAGRRSGPVAVAIPGKPASAVQPTPNRSMAASTAKPTARPGMVMKNTKPTTGQRTGRFMRSTGALICRLWVGRRRSGTADTTKTRLRGRDGWAEDFENRLKPDVVPEASFPCGRQQVGVGSAALEERWSRDSRGGVR
jgi:hypothetical protein